VEQHLAREKTVSRLVKASNDLANNKSVKRNAAAK
jgi:hypothetical protein